MNPMQLFGNPKQMVMNQLKGQIDNPIFGNLIDMAEKNNTKGIEQFARNLLKQQGRDFDKEYAEFMKRR